MFLVVHFNFPGMYMTLFWDFTDTDKTSLRLSKIPLLSFNKRSSQMISHTVSVKIVILIQCERRRAWYINEMYVKMYISGEIGAKSIHAGALKIR